MASLGFGASKLRAPRTHAAVWAAREIGDPGKSRPTDAPGALARRAARKRERANRRRGRR